MSGLLDNVKEVLEAYRRGDYKVTHGTLPDVAPAPITYSYSGRLIGLGYDSPTPFDVAVSLGRECRYTGNGTRWYPVILHAFVVSDMVERPLKFNALNHDNPECITGDIPKPYKTPEMEELQDALLTQMYTDWGIYHLLPSKEEHAAIKVADNNALYGEVHTIGSYGLQKRYPTRCAEAEQLTVDYIMQYPPTECLTPSGTAVIEFLRRYHEYLEYTK